MTLSLAAAGAVVMVVGKNGGASHDTASAQPLLGTLLAVGNTVLFGVYMTLQKKHVFVRTGFAHRRFGLGELLRQRRQITGSFIVESFLRRSRLRGAGLADTVERRLGLVRFPRHDLGLLGAARLFFLQLFADELLLFLNDRLFLLSGRLGLA